MKLGVHLVTYDFEGGPLAIAPMLAATGKAVDEAGIDNLSVMDHYWQMEMVGGPDLNMLEGYTTLGFLAAHTRAAELQMLVTGTTYRHPGLLAKIISTLDVLSGGRAALGIGAAWYEAEAVGLGVPFPSTRERFERLEETLQIVRQMWSDDEGRYDGMHYQLGRTLNRPQPIRTPPIMIGGTGEKKTLRFVAKYGDACNLFADPADASGTVQKLEILREHCQNEDSSYDRLRKTITCMAPADPAEGGAGFVEQMRAFADIGIDEVHVMPPSNDPAAFVQALGDHVVPGLSTL
ncbi:MAG TPA: LLM class F420-dependent oxidoreductase [Microlunatus sp.]